MTMNFGSVTCCSRVLRRLIIIGVFLTAFGFGWIGGYDAYWPLDSQREETAGPAIDAVVERIIGVESNGDPNARNKRSSATGPGQFLDETWLDMIRAHRPDLAHFAGGEGAVAILSAMENADAALVMATADATGRTKREKIIKANPFLERFTVADLRNWADRKMQVPGS
jgi:hypothetical protein